MSFKAPAKRSNIFVQHRVGRACFTALATSLNVAFKWLSFDGLSRSNIFIQHFTSQADV